MFHYFIPGVTKEQVAPNDKLDHAFLSSFGGGLGEVLADVVQTPADATVIYRKGPLSEGPGAGFGTLIAPTRRHESGPLILCDGNLQTWRPGPASRYFLGYLTAERPNPRSLERKETFGGEETPDDSGNVWRVAIIRAPHFGYPYGCLPQSYSFGDSGEVVPQLLPQYQALWLLAGEVRDWYRSNAELADDAAPEERTAHQKRPFTELVQAAAKFLALNYRLGPAELNCLSSAGFPVLTQKTVHSICQAAYGWQIEDEAKKKPPGESSTPAANLSSSKTGDETPNVAPGTAPVVEH